jgi:hypothetical protein
MADSAAFFAVEKTHSVVANGTVCFRRFTHLVSLMPKKWEYKVIAIEIDASTRPRGNVLEFDLNQMGDDEWELVAVAPRTKESKDGYPYAAIFKRPKN